MNLTPEINMTQDFVARHYRNLILKTRTPPAQHGETIQKLCPLPYYVHQDEKVSDLAVELDHFPQIPAIGVVDDHNHYKGIVVRRELFNLLGKPYGQDLMRHKSIRKIMQPALTFDSERNIYSVGEEISDILEAGRLDYFALTSGRSEFSGVFSSTDMMAYLARQLQKDINLARSLQRSIVREEELVNSPFFSVCGASRMAKGVGGDFYHLHDTKTGKLYLSLCDVSGKGIAASLVTTSISGMFHLYDFSQGFTGLLGALNSYIIRSFESQRFITGLFTELNPSSGDMVLYDMGHSYSYLYRDRKFYRLQSAQKSMPLGVIPGLQPEAVKIRLQKGDQVLLITDGLLEQVNSKGEEFGEKNFRRIVLQNAHKGIKALKDALFKALLDFRGNQPQHDDMTLVFLEYLPVQ